MTMRSHREDGARILAVGNMYPPQHAGGYELSWQQTMRRARELGHQVRVLTSDYLEDPDRQEEDPDVHRTLRWYWDLERYEFPRLTLAQRASIERHNAAVFRRHLEQFAPDVITWWSMGCMSLGLIEQGKRAGLPAVCMVHDDWLTYGRQHDQWIRTWSRPGRRGLGWAVERACGIPTRFDPNGVGRWVFNSRYTLERARQAGLSDPQATVLYPGIRERLLEPAQPRPWRWRLVYVGRLDRQKGIDTAIAALSELPPTATLAIWGTGDEEYVSEMRALAARLGADERVTFEGFADPKCLRSVYEEADVLVFPVRWNEPFGAVPLEAMGVGRPVVTTARGGTAEYVRDGCNALVFEADDAVGLAGCVRHIAEDEQLRARLCLEGSRTAARFSVSRFAQAAVEEILAVPRHARSASADRSR